MTIPADLEIMIHRWDPDLKDYAVEMRFRDPLSFEERDPALDRTQFDLPLLRRYANEYDIEKYGRTLTKNLFTSRLFEMFRDVCGKLEDKRALRLRLFITSSVFQLNELWWETLLNPLTLETGGVELLAASETILFSRYLSSPHFRPVQLRHTGSRSALVVIANSEELGGRGKYRQLNRFPIESIFGRTLDALSDVRLTFLGAVPDELMKDLPGNVTVLGKRATLETVITHLRGESEEDVVSIAPRDRYDILYLICHGAIVSEKPLLYMEDDGGGVKVEDGIDFSARISQLQQRPSLVVLASCQSAGGGEHELDEVREGGNGEVEADYLEQRGALTALGPRLTRAGIPAVVAMQGNVAQETLTQFIPPFFRELRREGQVDRAVAVARSHIKLRDERWLPTLFSRLSSGRIWHNRGFARDERGKLTPKIKWDALLASIRAGLCTPIIGTGVNESLVGSTRDIARRWAATYHFPMSHHAEEDLPQVAQYLSVNQNPFFIRHQLKVTVSREIIRRFRDNKPFRDKLPPRFYDRLPEVIEDKWLEELLELAWQNQVSAEPTEAHRVLADLPCPIYLTTKPDGLPFHALESGSYYDEEGKPHKKEPQREFYRWSPQITNWPPRISKNSPDYCPSVEKPLVYHLFGGLGVPNSVVLTEDDYLAYLYNVTVPENSMPSYVRTAMTDRALLFLGYNLEDWDFRVLVQSFREKGGTDRLQNYTHVAVQLNPEETRMIDPDRAREYLELRFGEIIRGMKLSIYWGSVEEFMAELSEKWNDAYDGWPIGKARETDTGQ